MKHSFYEPYKKPISYILLVILFGSAFTYPLVKKSLFPEITFPKIKIIADNGDQPVEKMMVTVTKPLEEAIKKIPDIQKIRNITSRGSSEISAFLSWDADIYTSQQLIESRINQIRNQLPPTTQLTIERMNPSILPVMGFMLEGKDMSLIELKKIAKYQVKPFLSQLEGISQIQVQGGKEKEYWVTLQANAMTHLGITPMEVQTAISNTGFLESNGFATDYHRMYLTVTDAAVYTINEMNDIVIRNDGNRIVRLSDIASISVERQIEYVKINTNGKEGVLVNVVKQPNKNLINLSDEVKSKVSELQNLLPKGVHLTNYYDQSAFVGESIRSVIDAIWIGLLLAIIITILFLQSFRSSFTILITIPATLSLSLISLHYFGYTLNLMTLGAVAAGIGLIIDDAIIVVEQIHRVWEEFPKEKPKEHIRQAFKYLFPAMVGSSVSTIVIFFPFSLMSGVAGAFFKVLADTMIITLVSSFFVVWLILPVIYLLIAGNTHKETRTTHQTKPAKWSAFFLRYSSFSFVFILIIVVSSYLVIPYLPTGFLPEMDEGSIVLDYSSPSGSSLEETNRMLNVVDKIVREHPQVENYSRRTGTQMGFFITEPNRGDYLIQLKKGHSKTTQDVTNDIRIAVEQQVPALQVDFGQVINDMLGDLMSSVQPIEIKIFGNNPTLLKSYAERITELVKKVPGTADVFDGIVIAGPSITIDPDEQALSYYQITPSDLWLQLQTQIQGVPIAAILESEQLTPMRMIYPENLQTNISKIDKAQIILPNGITKPLSDFASIQINEGSAEIERENLQPLIAITSRLDNRDLGSTVSEIKTTINKQISLPKGYRIEYGGAYAEQQQSFKELLLVLFTSSILVFTVILFLFKDLGASIVIFLTSILGVTGSILALYFTNTPLNVGSYTGIIMIVGIIAENAIFTYYQFKHALEESQLSLEEAIIYSISLRLRPKLMTATAAITALMPLALALGAGAQLHQPLAIAVIGGLVIALPLLLVVLPSFIKILYKVNGFEKKHRIST